MYFFLHIGLWVLISLWSSLCVCAEVHTPETHKSLMLILLHFPASLLIPVILNKDAARTAGKREFEEDVTLTF